jgi:hypothetical protein
MTVWFKINCFTLVAKRVFGTFTFLQQGATASFSYINLALSELGQMSLLMLLTMIIEEQLNVSMLLIIGIEKVTL